MTDNLQEAVNAKAGPVTVKLSRLVNARQALSLLMGTSLPAPLALRLSRLSRAAEQELEEFDRQRERLLKELGETTDGQNFIFPDAEKRAAFESQMGALGEETVVLPAVTLTLKDLGEREFPPATFGALDWMFPEMTTEPEPAPEG